MRTANLVGGGVRYAVRGYTVETEDHEEAARMNNTCRRRGILGSSVDFLLCAVAARRRWTIFSPDNDFKTYVRFLDGKLLPIDGAAQ